MLDVRDLILAYGVNRVVREVSFAVPEGEVFALLGPNGAGKTSILRAVSGLLAPVSGDIRLEGESLVGLPPPVIVRKGVSQVPEGRHVFPEMTIQDNLLVGATPRWRDRARVRELLERSYEMFPVLRDRHNQSAGTLSGGEQQQLVIARGLMADPRVLLMDEPTLGLAPVIVELLLEKIPLLLEFGLTVLMAEQNADFALKVAQSGAVLASGVVSFAGDVETLSGTEEVRRAYLGA